MQYPTELSAVGIEEAGAFVTGYEYQDSEDAGGGEGDQEQKHE